MQTGGSVVVGASLRHLEFVSHTTLSPISLGAWHKGGQTSLPGLPGGLGRRLGWGSHRQTFPSGAKPLGREQAPETWAGELLGHLPGTRAAQAAYGGSRGTPGTGWGRASRLSCHRWELAGHAILGGRVRPEHGLRFWEKSSISRPHRSTQKCADREQSSAVPYFSPPALHCHALTSPGVTP